ncbi:MAG: hypothetical protein EXS15_04815 [Phycisphaerales bacterium]|nr:hypothetical protein [Phycisphaerales bacterium]
MSLQTQWEGFATRLGTSPRQFAILLASAAAAVGIFGTKLVMSPKSATAAPVAAAVMTKAVEPAPATTLPETLLLATPQWNLASLPARSPFASPSDLQPELNLTADPAAGSEEGVKSTMVLQATLDRTLAVVNGRALRVGQSWIDPKSKQSFVLIEVGERNARFSCGSRMFEVSLDG